MSALSKIPAVVSGADQFHQLGITGKNITIAVMDSGLAPHKEIERDRILAFHDLTLGKTVLYDDYSHGTHVTGIAAASSIGIAPECNLVILKVLDKNGNSQTDLFIEGIKWILAHKNIYNIRVLNISIGGNSDELKREYNRLNTWIKMLWDSGVVVCCSAGNNGPVPGSISAPGNCKEVITVGSYDGKHFSSAGPLLPYITKPELVAPGYRIVSLKPYSGYSIKSGTSMSVPFISGMCALLLQIEPSLTNNQIKTRLMDSAYNIPFLPYNMQGAGIVNLKRLLTADNNNYI